MARFVEPKESFQIRRNVHRDRGVARVAQGFKLGTMLKNVTRIDRGHGLEWCAWNGNRAAGWTFYCACGHCTPMRRSFSEGLDLMEKHSQYRLSVSA